MIEVPRLANAVLAGKLITYWFITNLPYMIFAVIVVAVGCIILNKILPDPPKGWKAE